MGSGSGDWARIAEFWRVLEMIEPRAIPRATRAREKREPGTDFVETIELRLGQSVPPLPWQEGHRRFAERPTQGRYGSVWRHTVYGGVFGAPPNLLNVAVSRARRRLYVIDSYPEWQSAPNFGVFAAGDTFAKYDFFASS